ncbi:MAG: zinc ribbon domain-containing protein [Anaerolineales bacterium]
MELGTIILLLGVLVIVVLFVAEPFAEHWHVKAQSGQDVSRLLAESERALSALRELDFDYGLGKVPAEEYSVQRAGLLQKGADALRRLDEIQGTQPSLIVEPVAPAVFEQPVKILSDDELEDLVAKRRAARKQKTAGFCPKCGKPIMQFDQFCPFCGRAVNPEQSQP